MAVEPGISLLCHKNKDYRKIVNAFANYHLRDRIYLDFFRKYDFLTLLYMIIFSYIFINFIICLFLFVKCFSKWRYFKLLLSQKYSLTRRTISLLDNCSSKSRVWDAFEETSVAVLSRLYCAFSEFVFYIVYFPQIFCFHDLSIYMSWCRLFDLFIWLFLNLKC